jgi:predicted dinucleotide-binding enzyme
MLYAGDDARANWIVAGLAAEIGFEPIYLGRSGRPVCWRRWRSP